MDVLGTNEATEDQQIYSVDVRTSKRLTAESLGLAPKRQKMEPGAQQSKEYDEEKGEKEETKESDPGQSDQYLQRQKNDQKAARRLHLLGLAKETISLLPGVLTTVPQVSTRSYEYGPSNLPKLALKNCPCFRPKRVKVVNEDCLDAAVNIDKCSRYITFEDQQPVCILNMANAYSPGGGFRNGAMAQEEAICYRSSLYFTLKKRFYPLHDHGGLFSPTVVVFRHGNEGGTLMDLSKPQDLPVVSVISVAALCRPKIKHGNSLVIAGTGEPGNARHELRLSTVETYDNPQDRHEMKERMRVILRIAAYNRCRRLVLGAFGCGAFRNPNREVATCWAEVLSESEFRGGWWEVIVFAVCDTQNSGNTSSNGASNYDIFHDVLNGLVVT